VSHVEYHRTIWLSDIHLGSRECRVGLLLDFLTHTKCDVLYLVGDIIDLRSLRRSFFWPRSHTDVLRHILKKARDGTRVLYVPGNHDDDFRALAGTRFGHIEIEQQLIHTTVDGKRLLVLHGDEFDSALKYGALAVLVGHVGYRVLLMLNRLNHGVNALLGRPYWSLAQSLKMRLGNAVRYVARFQNACLHAAREARVDGVVCGHIHKADILERDGLTYCNDGDWVESCTALVEDHRGELSLRHWCRPTAGAHGELPVPLRTAA
jgi:UDP-2,3-diacylglucosamine pyrophosphatase LpxH